MGSGTTALAAIQLDRFFIGFDISPEYCNLARERIVKEGKIHQLKVSFVD
jgi:DNA modification methylase